MTVDGGVLEQRKGRYPVSRGLCLTLLDPPRAFGLVDDSPSQGLPSGEIKQMVTDPSPSFFNWSA